MGPADEAEMGCGQGCLMEPKDDLVRLSDPQDRKRQSMVQLRLRLSTHLLVPSFQRTAPAWGKSSSRATLLHRPFQFPFQRCRVGCGKSKNAFNSIPVDP
jgi:hypothetical protein